MARISANCETVLLETLFSEITHLVTRTSFGLATQGERELLEATAILLKAQDEDVSDQIALHCQQLEEGYVLEYDVTQCIPRISAQSLELEIWKCYVKYHPLDVISTRCTVVDVYPELLFKGIVTVPDTAQTSSDNTTSSTMTQQFTFQSQ